MVAVIDGLGHGKEASERRRGGRHVLATDPAAPVDELVRRCHASMSHTRGAVMSLASFALGSMTWVGVGQRRRIARRAQRSERRGGRDAQAAPSATCCLRSSRARCPSSQGDTLVLATDGIRHGFSARSCARLAQLIADAMPRDTGARQRMTPAWSSRGTSGAVRRKDGHARHGDDGHTQGVATVMDPKRAQLEHEYMTALRDASAGAGEDGPRACLRARARCCRQWRRRGRPRVDPS